MGCFRLDESACISLIEAKSLAYADLAKYSATRRNMNAGFDATFEELGRAKGPSLKLTKTSELATRRGGEYWLEGYDPYLSCCPSPWNMVFALQKQL